MVKDCSFSKSRKILKGHDYCETCRIGPEEANKKDLGLKYFKCKKFGLRKGSLEGSKMTFSHKNSQRIKANKFYLNIIIYYTNIHIQFK